MLSVVDVQPPLRLWGGEPKMQVQSRAALEERIGSLEKQLDVRAEELRRKDHIIAGLVERVPELEAPQEPREAPQTVAEAPGGVVGREDEGGRQERRSSWWRTWFGFE